MSFLVWKNNTFIEYYEKLLITIQRVLEEGINSLGVASLCKNLVYSSEQLLRASRCQLFLFFVFFFEFWAFSADTL